MEASSVELLERARSGDDAALDALLDRHQEQIYRFGMRMCRDPEDAKDVLQETLLAMARGVRGFRGVSSISTKSLPTAPRARFRRSRPARNTMGTAAMRTC